jgi:archaellum component FlaF (FlaF/FlaG flagellin family)
MRSSRAVTAVIAVVAMLLILAPMVGAAVAQEQTPTSTETSDSSPNSVVAQVDEDIRVVDYSYRSNDSAMVVTLSNVGGGSSTVTLTEAISPDGSGSGTFGIERVTVRPGEQVTVAVSVNPEPREHGVMITTEKSISNGEGTYLQVDEGGGSLFEGSATWNLVRLVYIVAIASAFLTLFFGVWMLIAARHEGTTDADLEPERDVWGGFRD